MSGEPSRKTWNERCARLFENDEFKRFSKEEVEAVLKRMAKGTSPSSEQTMTNLSALCSSGNMKTEKLGNVARSFGLRGLSMRIITSQRLTSFGVNVFLTGTKLTNVGVLD